MRPGTLWKSRLGVRERLRTADIPEKARVHPGLDPGDEEGDHLGGEIDHGPAKCGQAVQDFRRKHVDSAVRQIAWRIGDLLVEGRHPAPQVQLKDSAVPRSVGPEGQQGQQDISVSSPVRCDEFANVSIRQVVGVKNKEGVASKPFTARQDSAAGTQQGLLVNQFDAIPPAALRHMRTHLTGQMVSVDPD